MAKTVGLWLKCNHIHELISIKQVLIGVHIFHASQQSNLDRLDRLLSLDLDRDLDSFDEPRRRPLLQERDLQIAIK